MQVRDAMTEKPISTSKNALVYDAIDIMFENDVRHVPVTENGRLVGILSDRDVRSFVFDDSGKAGTDTKVSEVMTGGVLSVGPDDAIWEAVDLILDERVGAVPVVDPAEETLVGIVSYVDVLKLLREAR